MSAYMLDDDKFQYLANWMKQESTNTYGCSARYMLIHHVCGGDFKLTEEEIEKCIGRTIRNFYNLNRLALVTRYGERYERADATSFIPESIGMYTNKMAYKILKSLRYQCSEYMAGETKTYDQIDRLVGSLAELIVDAREE